MREPIVEPKVYIETSVISYLTALPSRDVVVVAHQHITHAWWMTRNRFDLYVSQAVLTEAGGGDPKAATQRLAAVQGMTILDVTSDASDLAATFVEAGILPTKALIDAVHVATAAVHGMDYLLMWNCTHLANAAIRGKLEESCRALGLQPPLICTPEELTR